MAKTNRFHTLRVYIVAGLWVAAVAVYMTLLRHHRHEVLEGYICADTAHTAGSWSWFPLGARCPGGFFEDGTLAVCSFGALILLVWGVISMVGVVGELHQVLILQAQRGRVYLHQAGAHARYGSAVSDAKPLVTVTKPRDQVQPKSPFAR